MDDQLKRCLQAEEEGWGRAHQPGTGHVTDAIATLLEMNRVPQSSENGAVEVVKILGIGSP